MTQDDFTAAYEHEQPVLYAALLGILRNAEDARDALQDALLQAWRQRDRFNPTRGSRGAWLLTLARSRGIDLLRRRAVRAAAAGPAVPASPPDMLDVRLALRALPANDRELLLLSFVEEFTNSELATRMGTPLGTVKARVRRAKKKLRRALR